MPRSVVPLPPVIVTKPSTPSVLAWSNVLNVRESSRPESAASPLEPISGRAADHAARNVGRAHRGDQLRALLVHPPHVVLGHVEVVGILDHPRARADHREPALGHDDVAVAGLVQAVDDHVAQAPAQGQQHARRGPDRHVDAGHRARSARTTGRSRSPRCRRGSRASLPVTRSRTAAPRHACPLHDQAVHVDVVRMSAPLCPRGREEAQRHPHRVHRAVGHAHGRLAAPGSGSARGAALRPGVSCWAGIPRRRAALQEAGR